VRDGDEFGQELVPLPSGSLNVGLGIAVLTPFEDNKAQIEPLLKQLGNEAISLMNTDAAPNESFGFAGHAFFTHVDRARFEQWNVALGRTPDRSAECDFAFVSYPLSKVMMETAVGVLTFLAGVRFPASPP